MSIVGGLMTLLALLLPWFQVSCSGIKIEIEGYRILTGTTQEKIQQLSGQLGRMGSANPAAAQQARSSEQPSYSVVAWLVLILLAAQAASGRKSWGAFAVGAAVFAGAALIFFFVMTNAQAQQQIGQGGGLVEFSWSAGFWLACTGTVLTGIGAALRLADTS